MEFSVFSSSFFHHNRTFKVWHLDTCAFHYITANLLLLLDPKPYQIDIKVGSSTIIKFSHNRIVRLVYIIDNQDVSLSLSNGLYLPEWKKSDLVSWSKITALKKYYLQGEDISKKYPKIRR